MKNSYQEIMKHINLDDTAKERILSGVEAKLKERRRRRKKLGMLMPAAAAAVLALMIGTSGLLGSFDGLQPSDPAVFSQHPGGIGDTGNGGEGSGAAGGKSSTENPKDGTGTAGGSVSDNSGNGSGNDAIPFEDSKDASSGDTTADNSQDRSRENSHYRSTLTAAMKDCGFDSDSDILSIRIYMNHSSQASDDPKILKNAEYIGRMYRILTGGSWRDFDTPVPLASDRSAKWIRIDFKLKNGKIFRTGVDPQSACLYILSDDGTLTDDKYAGGAGYLQLQTNDLAWIISLVSGK